MFVTLLIKGHLEKVPTKKQLTGLFLWNIRAFLGHDRRLAPFDVYSRSNLM